MHQAKIRQFLPPDNLRGRTAIENVTGRTSDISEYCDFDFYDLVWCHPGLHPNFNEKNRTLVRWLGVYHKIGSYMCYYRILKKSGTVISATTVKHVTRDDMLDVETAAQVKIFNSDIDDRLDDKTL